ncbi:MAG: bifunctional anthranilate synthase component I family protein/class IV aminotransferase [Thermoanaerobaculia bacterium]
MTDHDSAKDGPRALVRAPEEGPASAGIGPGGRAPRWWCFRRPAAVLEATTLGEVPAVLAEAEEAARTRRLWALGFLAYEASPAFDPALVTHRPLRGVPLAWFALFPDPEVVRGGRVPGGAPRAGERAGRLGSPGLRASLTDREYLAAVAAVRRDIARGETYQANLTYRLRTLLDGGAGASATAPGEVFRRLVQGQPSPFATFLESGAPGGWAVCSVSPELFFERRGRRMSCRPMKGTAPRGATEEEDRRLAAELRASAKERAENLMIVDMVRNDLGRIARTRSVRADRLFTVERYPTVLQMTSEVSGESGAPLAEVFRALFPCASVTGAPKVRTMEILRRLEKDPRGLYTGALGWIAPGGDARFSVAIRTAWMARDPGGSVGRGPGADGAAGRRWRVEYGTGSGVVWDSDPERELAETRTKAVALRRALGMPAEPGWERPGTCREEGASPGVGAATGRPGAGASSTGEDQDFQLLETLLWTPRRGFALLGRHLERLARSARELGFAVDTGAAGESLEAAVRDLPARHHRVRLLAERSGGITVQVLPAGPTRRPWRIALAAAPIDPDEPLLTHKTTRRGLYERALERVRAEDPELDDVLLWNDRGELAESTVANLVLAPRGRSGPLLTPPVRSGLLPGTFRAELLVRGRVREAILAPEDLAQAERVYLVSSVRGWIPAVVVGIGKNEPERAVPTEDGASRRPWTGVPGGVSLPPRRAPEEDHDRR